MSCGCWLTRLLLEGTLVIKLLHLCISPVRSVSVRSHILLHRTLHCSEHPLKLFYETALSACCLLHTPNVASGRFWWQFSWISQDILCLFVANFCIEHDFGKLTTLTTIKILGKHCNSITVCGLASDWGTESVVTSMCLLISSQGESRYLRATSHSPRGNRKNFHWGKWNDVTFLWHLRFTFLCLKLLHGVTALKIIR